MGGHTHGAPPATPLKRGSKRWVWCTATSECAGAWEIFADSSKAWPLMTPRGFLTVLTLIFETPHLHPPSATAFPPSLRAKTSRKYAAINKQSWPVSNAIQTGLIATANSYTARKEQSLGIYVQIATGKRGVSSAQRPAEEAAAGQPRHARPRCCVGGTTTAPCVP